MSIALIVLDNVRNKFMGNSESGGYMEPGSVLRCIGRYSNAHDAQTRPETEPVVFMSSPHLILHPTSNKANTRDEGCRPRSLLHSHYGYDVGIERESGQVIRKMSKNRSKKDILHISQLWCLLIGTGILITFSDQSIQDQCGNTIAIDPRTSGNREPLTIRLVDEDSRQYNLAIEPDYNYVDFLRHAVSLVRGTTSHVSDYRLFGPDDKALTPERWIEILTSLTSELHIFHLKTEAREEEELDYEELMSGPIAPEARRPSILERSKARTRRTLSRELIAPLMKRKTGSGASTTRLRARRHGSSESGHFRLRSRRDRYMEQYGMSPQSEVMEQATLREPSRSAMLSESVSSQQPSENHGLHPPIHHDTTFGPSPLPQTIPVDSEETLKKEIENERRAGAKSVPMNLASPGTNSIPNSNPIPIPIPNYPSYPNLNPTHIWTQPRGKPGEDDVAYNDYFRPHIPQEEEENCRDLVVSGRHAHDGSAHGSCDGSQSRHRGRSSRRQNSTRPQKTGIVLNEYPRPTSVEPKLFDVGELSDAEEEATNCKNEDDVSEDSDSSLFECPSEHSSEHVSIEVLDSSYSKTTHMETTAFNPHTRVDPASYNASRLRSRISRVAMYQLQGSTSAKGSRSSSRTTTPPRSRSRRRERISPRRSSPSIHSERNSQPSVPGDAEAPEYAREPSPEPEFTIRQDVHFASVDGEGHAEDNRSSRTRTSHRPVNLSTITTIPFFTWRLGNEAGERTPDAVEKTLVKILSQLDKSLTSDIIGRLYSRTPKITMQELFLRHELCPALSSSGGPVMQTSDRDKTAMKTLLEVSQEIIWAFTPKEGSPLIHNVCIRFWGALDAIFRQIAWEESDRGPAEKREYAIRDFDLRSSLIDDSSPVLLAGKKSWADCPDCKSGRLYSSATEALEHLHKEHFECTGKTERPYSDRCFVWLRRHWPTGYFVRKSHPRILTAVEAFIKVLLPISSSARELHSLVANVWNRQSGDKEIPRPFLPRNLVNAFKQIMQVYICHARCLSLLNRASGLLSGDMHLIGVVHKAIAQVTSQGEAARDRAQDLLADAKKDIILLGNTSRNIDSLRVEAVGSEFLALALVCVGQNRQIRPDLSPPTLRGPDFIQLYQTYTSRLGFQANRRPQKRVFLDIHSLEEELGALEGLVKAQKALLAKFLKITSPQSFRVTNTTRMGQYRTEVSNGNLQLSMLSRREGDIDILKVKAKSLKEQVKQTIEILEEDHGKAIRVFTIVTVFFLPLSFVSSFMGMNTTDIRDTKFSQRIFWITAIPVTVAVLGLAFVYGYKGDEFENWLSQQPRWPTAGRIWGSRRKEAEGDGWIADAGRTGTFNIGTRAATEDQGMLRANSEKMNTAMTANGQWQSGQKGYEDGQRGVPSWMQDMRARLSNRRREKTGQRNLQRRPTGDSLGPF
ncbi:hypothetical protein B0T10DRAFT_47532 [Thelonectria olida]|uniref:Mg2+ transporter protein, CorA-like/Zinc transport protein ZntB n=1 Tax=Thelonectria olida TaxID=1576542 RepID=A0A9P8W428_9HYPO|nr:hypothetical protein B0T10DRAFT_47532 [Thelonectria olida]